MSFSKNTLKYVKKIIKFKHFLNSSVDIYSKICYYFYVNERDRKVQNY